MSSSLPTRQLREHPDLDQLKRQAKELLHAFRAGEAEALAEVNAHYRAADPATFALHDAQLVLARSYGFTSWPKLKAFVDGVTVKRLVDAVGAGDLAAVRALLQARPELVHLDMAPNNEHRALHYAVLQRSPDVVRLLMEHGADAHKGIYPHRDATSALTIAVDRGYDEIVSIIQEAEERRGAVHSNASTSPRGSDPLADALRTAVAAGDADFLRARHADGTLLNPIESDGGLLTVAVKQDRAEMLTLLLELGLNPNERTRVDDFDEPVFTSGMPLWHCAVRGKHALAEVLLQHGADPNARVYASGTPLSQAYGQRDQAMIELLERHGGKPSAMIAGHYRLTELARRMLAGEVDGQIEDGTFAGKTLAEQLLWAAACGGDPEIVRLALERIDWPRDDPRWYRMLEQPVRIWNHGPVFWANEAFDRSTYVTCFRLILERCDPNVRGRFGLTMLHDISASRQHVTAEERLAFATLLLDAGARLDVRDELLRSTPLGWACRWGRVELVKLLLERGADPIEADAEPWATPPAWAIKHGHDAVLALLDRDATA